MTGNKAYLAEYQDFNGGPVAFGGSKGYITGKGKIKTGKLDFEDVCFVKELQHFNIFFVSQMCDKKNKVLFTDSECLVLSPEFKLPDANQVLLRIPRQNNMYSFNLENIVPSRGKQHKASCKAKSVNSISHSLQLLHMDLFGPTSVRSLNHKTYCLVITDDFSRFSWVFFLRTKDETSGLLKDFIRQIENYLNQKVKTFRCDNGTEFKNRNFIEFCGSKGIKREYSNARTPQQNGVAERKNKTLIEAVRTMLADSFLPNTFWAEAVSTACYVLNRVLVTKPHNKTPYELVTGKGPTWLFDLDYLIDSMNYQPVRSENQANKHAGPQEANQNAGIEDIIDAGNSEKEAESAQDYFALPIWSSYSSTVKRSTAKDACEAPTKHPDLKTDEKPVDKEDQAGFAQETEDWFYKSGAAKASSTNIVNTASTPVSTTSPYGGLSFTDLTNPDQDDSEIAALEDIYNNPTDGIFTNSSYDDEGAVADFTNLELVVNVSPIPTSRINSIHPSTLILGDPQSQKNYCNSRFKKVWYSCIFAYWEEGTFEQKWVYTETDKYEERSCIGRNNQGPGLKPLGIFLAFSSYMAFIVPIKEDVKDKYVAEILKKFDFVSVKTASTLIETQKPLVKDEEASDVDVHLYRSMIGSLMYFNCDLVLKNVAVYACSRFPGHSKDLSTKSVKRIFRYLKGKPKLGLLYPIVSSFDLEAYSDSDYAGANLDRKSTTGGCQFLGRRLISWQCKKQTIVATSTIKEKYVAATNCCGQVLWIQNQMLDYREFWWNHGGYRSSQGNKTLEGTDQEASEESQTCYYTPQSLDEECILEAKIGRKEILEEKLDAKESVSKQGRKSA
ncbi:putative ribonuclease H-like domain-containing protein [Tanacetum coccineum]|uniref:Ribonuclease H-like domain-containing protein n=1 Tax=Tanacetum coccineum TaxID=301880 RepID=A0ABQ4XTB9_9ASTR